MSWWHPRRLLLPRERGSSLPSRTRSRITPRRLVRLLEEPHMETSGKQKPRAKVMRMEEAFWELPPGHVQAYSKLLVHPSNAEPKYLDFRISSYQPKGYAEVHLHEVAVNLYYILEGKGIVELDGER